MNITGSLVIDLSLWDHHINAQELIDGGVKSVILGLYKYWDGSKYILNPNCKRIIDQIVASNLILQTYYYVYPQRDPLIEANWFVDAMKDYPVKFAWADCEDMGAVMGAAARSEKYRIFTAEVKSHFENTGVYTRKTFVDAYAPEMNLWIGKYPSWIAHYGYQPTERMMITWEQVNLWWLPHYNVWIPSGTTNFVGHQFTGDRFMLPGVYGEKNERLPLDVSVFKDDFLQSLTAPAPVLTMEERMVRVERILGL